ncbi:hypothetical protein ACFONC_09590 [Luteimonas soli]|uniref:DUF4426 domain-containing protein n=1 Tax=Luteimonas soli TaxID=1648966 RepID=A0ABV7XLI9_9GAMM
MSFYRHLLVALLVGACGQVHALPGHPGAEPAARIMTPMFYGIEMSDEAVVELAAKAPVAAAVLSSFRARPTIDPIDMYQGVSYFSARPNARSVRALLDGDEQANLRQVDPLAPGERLRAIFRTVDDASVQDGRMTLSIEAIGDNTAERTTLVELEKVEGATVSVDIVDRPAPVYRVAGISFVD